MLSSPWRQSPRPRRGTAAHQSHPSGTAQWTWSTWENSSRKQKKRKKRKKKREEEKETETKSQDHKTENKLIGSSSSLPFSQKILFFCFCSPDYRSQVSGNGASPSTILKPYLAEAEEIHQGSAECKGGFLQGRKGNMFKEKDRGKRIKKEKHQRRIKIQEGRKERRKERKRKKRGPKSAGQPTFF